MLGIFNLFSSGKRFLDRFLHRFYSRTYKRKISPCSNCTLLLFVLDWPLVSACSSCLAERCTNPMQVLEDLPVGLEHAGLVISD